MTASYLWACRLLQLCFTAFWPYPRGTRFRLRSDVWAPAVETSTESMPVSGDGEHEDIDA